MREYYAATHFFIQSEQRKMAEMQSSIYSSPKPGEQASFSLGDVLASARQEYGTPWVSALQIPRRSNDLFVFVRPNRNGYTYSFNAFTARRGRNEGLYLGEPRLYLGDATYRGVTEGFWNAFSQNYSQTGPDMFGGELSLLSGVVS